MAEMAARGSWFDLKRIYALKSAVKKTKKN